MKLSQIRLITDHFLESIVFYRDVLEFPLAYYHEEMQFASFDIGETKLELFARAQIATVIKQDHLLPDGGASVVPFPANFLLSFAVDQVDEFCNKLKGKQVIFLNEPHDRTEWNARIAHLHDPDNNVIELYTHPL